MEDKTIYLIQLEKLLSKASAESVTIMSKRLWKLQLIIDLCAVTQFFNDELVKIEECYNLDIDKDVNYEEWASNEKWEPLQDTLRSRTKGRFNTEGKDIAYDIFSLVAKCIEVPSDEEMNKAQNNDNAENIRQLEKKEKREYYRSLLVSLDCNDEIKDIELADAVLKALNALQNVLKEISNVLSSSYKANEKRVALYDALNQKNLPQSRFPMWDAHKVWNEWKKNYYGDWSEEDMKAFIMTELFKLLNSGFVICDREHVSLTARNTKKCEIEEYIDDNVNDEDERKEAIIKYTFLRDFLEYTDGFYEIKNKDKMGRYIYEKRHEISEDNIKAFFCFLGLNILVKEEVAKKKNPKKVYKEIPQELYSFFTDSIFVEAYGESRKEKKTLDKDKLIHGISDMLEIWKRPTAKGASRKYRVLYGFLAKKKLFKDSGRELYKPFVENLLCYCYSLSEDDVKKVSDNIRKTDVKDSYIDMDDDDKKIYDDIKKELAEVISAKEDNNSVE